MDPAVEWGPGFGWVSGAEELQGQGHLYLVGGPHDLGSLKRQENDIRGGRGSLSKPLLKWPPFF